eukprot:GHVT01045129.1.p1 GENE.GHVT01045129.1~~GHVT01045129.1.p1  ORF type:complete len:534 (-),score=44.83 GHVT01045129.1:4076-5677(-)
MNTKAAPLVSPAYHLPPKSSAAHSFGPKGTKVGLDLQKDEVLGGLCSVFQIPSGDVDRPLPPSSESRPIVGGSRAWAPPFSSGGSSRGRHTVPSDVRRFATDENDGFEGARSPVKDKTEEEQSEEKPACNNSSEAPRERIVETNYRPSLNEDTQVDECHYSRSDSPRVVSATGLGIAADEVEANVQLVGATLQHLKEEKRRLRKEATDMQSVVMQLLDPNSKDEEGLNTRLTASFQEKRNMTGCNDRQTNQAEVIQSEQSAFINGGLGKKYVALQPLPPQGSYDKSVFMGEQNLTNLSKDNEQKETKTITSVGHNANTTGCYEARPPAPLPRNQKHNAKHVHYRSNAPSSDEATSAAPSGSCPPEKLWSSGRRSQFSPVDAVATARQRVTAWRKHHSQAQKALVEATRAQAQRRREFSETRKPQPPRQSGRSSSQRRSSSTKVARKIHHILHTSSSCGPESAGTTMTGNHQREKDAHSVSSCALTSGQDVFGTNSSFEVDLPSRHSADDELAPYQSPPDSRTPSKSFAMAPGG